jgi:nitroreductase/NAD-dependent dihydropyrimidine dehydrogenase PreA subunit
MFPTIIKEKCNGCGLCVEDCAWGILSIQDEKVGISNENICVGCGHCVAICPLEAIAYQELGEFRKANKFPEPEAIEDLLLMRRSVRKYRKREIPDEIIERLLKAAASGPTGCNCRSPEITVITNPEILGWIEEKFSRILIRLAKLSRNTLVKNLFETLPFIWSRRAVHTNLSAGAKAITLPFRNEKPFVTLGAPVLMIFHADPVNSTPAEDCVIAAQNVVILAQSLGLGTCYNGNVAGVLNSFSSFRKKLEIPAKHVIYTAVSLGYSSVRYFRSAPRSLLKVNYRK